MMNNKRRKSNYMFRKVYWCILYPLLILTSFSAFMDLYWTVFFNEDNSINTNNASSSSSDPSIKIIRQHPIPEKPQEEDEVYEREIPHYNNNDDANNQVEEDYWWREQQEDIIPTPVPTVMSTEYTKSLEIQRDEFVLESKRHKNMYNNNNYNNNNITKQSSYNNNDNNNNWNKAKSNPTSHKIIFRKPNLGLPRIVNPNNISTVILVLSAAGSPAHFIRRQAIRQTWKDKQTNVFFIVGQTKINNDGDQQQQQDQEEQTLFLRHEQELYGDLCEIPMEDDYKLLPEKVVQAYAWALQYFPNLQWLVKADDDTFVRVNKLEDYLEKYNSNSPILIGKIVPRSMVAREGKWAEHSRYKQMYYPYWPQGSSGHIVSQRIAKYIVQNSENLHRYQGEDVSIGIWLDEANKLSRLKVTYIQAESMITMDGTSFCTESKYLMIGHDITPDGMKYCQEQSVSLSRLRQEPEKKAWVDSPANFF